MHVEPDIPDEGLAAARAECEAVLRRDDRDRWLASMFAPEADRPHLHALYAFSSEIARIRDVVHEPMPGEIRLQWWRDALETEERGAFGHPVLMSLKATLAERRLPVRPLLDLIDARTFDLYDDPMPSLHSLEGYAGETQSALFQLSALVLARGEDPGTADASGHAGVAYALTGLMRTLPLHARRGQIFLPLDALAGAGVSEADMRQGNDSAGLRTALADLRERARMHLDAARDALAEAPAAIKAAYLPLALVPLWLRSMEALPPFEPMADTAQWKRQWVLWRAAGKARQNKAFF